MKFFNKYSVVMASVAGILMLFSFFENKQSKFFNIGITQIVEHEALDKARQGFIDELKNLSYEEGKNVKFDFQNAGGDFSNCESIASKFVNQNCDLILAISTPSAQAVANATKNIPILVTGITNPKEAGLVESNDIPNTNVTGTSDLSPVKETIKLITELKPDTKKVGVFKFRYEPNVSSKTRRKRNKKFRIRTDYGNSFANERSRARNGKSNLTSGRNLCSYR